MRYSTGRLRANLRQWRQPAAFRIESPRWDDEHRALLARLLDALTDATGSSTEPVEQTTEPTVPGTGLVDEQALAGAATSFWRARERLQQQTSADSPESRQAGRHLETSQEQLAEAGLFIQDHTGSVFHPGLSLDVLTFVDDPELTRPTVVQTIKPCVYLHDRRIQMAQVIVGQPAAPNQNDSVPGGIGSA